MQSTFRYDVKNGNAPDAYAPAPILWDGNAKSIILDIKIWDNNAYVTLIGYDGVTPGDDIEIDPEDPPLQIPHACRGFNIRNKTAGLVARYELRAYW